MPNRIMMIRPQLDELPSSDLAEPYAIRWHRDGDDSHWMAIKSASDTEHQAPPDFYERVYGAHRDALAQRQAFLCDGTGEPVGTVTAWWFDNLRDSSLGKVNWMLIVPHAQGRGLSKPLLTACCTRLALLGHTRAALYTLTSRVAAINLYRSFGFLPLIRHADDSQSWAATSPLLKRPYAETEYLRGGEIGINVAALTATHPNYISRCSLLQTPPESVIALGLRLRNVAWDGLVQNLGRPHIRARNPARAKGETLGRRRWSFRWGRARRCQAKKPDILGSTLV